MCSMAGERLTTAAGGIVWRKRPPGPHRRSPDKSPKVEVLVIHRPGYDDWTFPKGKPDPGEDLATTAVREIAEETGLRVRLGHPLPATQYRVASGDKRVSYWVARTVGTDHEPFTPNREVDELRWVRTGEARALLTYSHDVELLDAFSALREKDGHRTRTLVVLRHGKAADRADWKGDDIDRPLVRAGVDQARAAAASLAAFGGRRVVTSPALRCIQTVEPFAHSIQTFLQLDDRLGEDTRASFVQRSLEGLLVRKRPVVICTHRPTLPWVFDAVGLDAVDLKVGEGVVIHHRKGVVLASEPLAHPAHH
ncbi:hypothetical protein ASD11_01535 [Aeromicrobium sp. Root495]|nr:hypothetical protein ASD11_01535 [Aeromicrobium sp. Root495]